MQIFQVETMEQMAEIKELFREYADSLNFNLEFQNFEDELAKLPGKYALPAGNLLLAVENGKSAGCVGLRPITAEICEMKRLYTKPVFRGQKIGKALALAIIKEAIKLGYRKMRLDTVASMKEALALYYSVGFREIEAYCFNPIAGAVYLELNLTGFDGQSQNA
jgi:Acetyltransferases